MIEAIIWFVFTFLNMMFEGFVFMYGWNSFIHRVGLPTISYGLVYACLYRICVIRIQILVMLRIGTSILGIKLFLALCII